MVLPQTQSHFADALVADGPDPEHAEALMLFRRFVGAWDFDWAAYDDDGSRWRPSAAFGSSEAP